MTVKVGFAENLQSEVKASEMTVEAETFEELIAAVCAETGLTAAMFAWKDGRQPGLAILVEGGGMIKGRYRRPLAGRIGPDKGVRIMRTM